MSMMGFGARADAPALIRDVRAAQQGPLKPEPAQVFPLSLVKGTRIVTVRGDVAVEEIVQGDVILSQGLGAAPVVAVTICHLTRQALIAAHRLTPVLMRAGALGAGRPDRDLCLHPGTLLCADAMSGLKGPQRATDLIGDGRVMRIFPDSVTYVVLTLMAPGEVPVSGVRLTACEDGASMQSHDGARAPRGKGWLRIGDIALDRGLQPQAVPG